MKWIFWTNIEMMDMEYTHFWIKLIKNNIFIRNLNLHFAITSSLILTSLTSRPHGSWEWLLLETGLFYRMKIYSKMFHCNLKISSRQLLKIHRSYLKRNNFLIILKILKFLCLKNRRKFQLICLQSLLDLIYLSSLRKKILFQWKYFLDSH